MGSWKMSLIKILGGLKSELGWKKLFVRFLFSHALLGVYLAKWPKPFRIELIWNQNTLTCSFLITLRRKNYWPKNLNTTTPPFIIIISFQKNFWYLLKALTDAAYLYFGASRPNMARLFGSVRRVAGMGGCRLPIIQVFHGELMTLTSLNTLCKLYICFLGRK